jgi:hypothetical protein
MMGRGQRAEGKGLGERRTENGKRMPETEKIRTGQPRRGGRFIVKSNVARTAVREQMW